MKVLTAVLLFNSLIISGASANETGATSAQRVGRVLSLQSKGETCLPPATRMVSLDSQGKLVYTTIASAPFDRRACLGDARARLEASITVARQAAADYAAGAGAPYASAIADAATQLQALAQGVQNAWGSPDAGNGDVTYLLDAKKEFQSLLVGEATMVAIPGVQDGVLARYYETGFRIEAAQVSIEAML